MSTQNVKITSENNLTKVSVCDIMKNNTSAIIHKMETKVPTYMQLYSDLYTKYLEMCNNLFGTCYISEKHFFDKLGFEQNTLRVINDFWKSMANNCSSQIDMSSNFLRAYIEMRISAINTFEEHMQIMMDSYAKSISEINKLTYFSGIKNHTANE